MTVMHLQSWISSVLGMQRTYRFGFLQQGDMWATSFEKQPCFPTSGEWRKPPLMNDAYVDGGAVYLDARLNGSPETRTTAKQSAALKKGTRRSGDTPSHHETR